MGYPGDSNQPRQSWDSDPLDTDGDDWSRHPRSAPVPPQQQPAEQPGEPAGPWQAPPAWGEQPPAPPIPPAQPGQPGGSWLEGAAARPQGPLDGQQWSGDPLAAPPATALDPGTGGQPVYDTWQGQPEPSYDGPSGPQQSPWHDDVPGGGGSFGPGAGEAGTGTGTHALPRYDGQGSYDTGSYDADAYGEEARHDAERFGGGATASGSYEVPQYDPASYAAPPVPPQSAWGEPRPGEYDAPGGGYDPHAAPVGYDPHAAPVGYDGPGAPGEFGAPGVPGPPGEFGGHGGPGGPGTPNDFGGPGGWDAPPPQGGPHERGEQWQPEGARDEISGSRGGRKGLLVAGGVAVALVAGGAAAYALTRDGGTDKPGVAQSPPASGVPVPGATSSPEQPAASGGLLKSRKTDPRPLKAGEVFQKKRFTVKGTTYVMYIRKATKKCADAVHGEALQAALKRGRCTQFLRATFATKDGKMIGTVGVANLRTSQAAARAEKAAKAKDAYVLAVPGKGATAKIGQGDALGAAWVRGHYLIMTWVQNPDGKPIPAKQRKRAQIFAQNTVNGSNLGPALHIRDATGRPAA
ncbi:hypothetical protein LO762_14065 [Actinocorallia sp. API 0066]|uniref:hypothetical protein n=1 Tax=Actinocorallia sp. API 0066 TaxID=2896846 RepID=UPI001E627095|nr:hypothetical protein [Actinocorallia sp. API 0066]MCD0450308.1 hypothetical protein [Actinocorallia sp. API 0066]